VTRRHHEYLAAHFWCFRSRSVSRRRVYVASASWYLSPSRNCGRLLIAATQSSHLLLTKVRSHGNNVRDVIIAHVISADAQIYRRGNSKVILGPAGRARSARPAGKKSPRTMQPGLLLHAPVVCSTCSFHNSIVVMSFIGMSGQFVKQSIMF